jgi:hypothetical protein
MAIPDDLLTDIQAALGGAVVPSLNASSHESDLYEAYVFSLVLGAAQAEGATVSLHCVKGGVPNPFVFRTSPGAIWSRHRNYGYAVLDFQSCPPLEAHVSVRVSGHSQVLHECDVSVIRASEADACRNSSLRLSPRSAKVVIAMEAKYYQSDLGLHLGRGFLGLTTDLSADNAMFVMNCTAESVESLLAHKKKQWDHHIVPNRPCEVARLFHAIRIAFKNYKAKTRT